MNRMKFDVLVVDKDERAVRLTNIRDPLNVLLPSLFVATEEDLVHWSALKEVTIRVQKEDK